MQFRNRYISVGMLHDAEIGAGGPLARDLAFSLIVLADDQGRFNASRRFIWKEAYGHIDSVSLQACTKAFEHLVTIRYVLLYRHEGRDFGVIRNWHRFQPQKADRVRWSTIPAPPDWTPEKHLPDKLLERWVSDGNKASFRVPPISNEWISGDGLETWRRQPVSAAVPTGLHNVGLARAERMRDRGKNGREDEGRTDVETSGEVAAPQPAESNGAPMSWSRWDDLPVPKRRILLTNWLFVKHGWQTVEADTLQHEHAIADQIAGMAFDGDQLHTHLEAWWKDSDPDDRPSSLEYFWSRLNKLEGQGLKQQGRPHVRTSGLSRVGETLAGIRPRKGSD